MVIDQWAHHYLEKVQPHFKKGIKKLFDEGVVYNYAYHPHATPGTAVGHNVLNTGCLAKDHGIIGNKWINEEGKSVRYEKDSSGKALVFSEKGLYDFGASAKNIKVDGVSDQFMLTSKQHEKHEAWSLSYKARAAIGMGGKTGKTIWFDDVARRFTSSKAFFEKLPAWLETFNKKNKAERIPNYSSWKLKHPGNVLAYDGAFAENDFYSVYPFSLIGEQFGTLKTKPNEEIFLKTIHANQLLLNLSKKCVEDFIKRTKENDKLLLWISLSPLDWLGHFYGPDSKEALDIQYYLDYQLEDFMKFMNKQFYKEDILFVLTSDHGIMPIPDVLNKKGFKQAARHNPDKLIKEMNSFVSEMFKVENFVSSFQTPQFYFDKKTKESLDGKTLNEITSMLKSYLKSLKGIAEVWTFAELKNLNCEPYTIDWYYKNQMYFERSGDLTCKCDPYVAITKYSSGTHHRTPYEYDTHVPLVLYQHGSIEDKKIDKKVWMPQFANTLAKILNIPGPSASTFEILPGV